MIEKAFAWGAVIAFYIMQNIHFGWNHMAHSDAELIADGITLMLFLRALSISSRNQE